MNWAAVESHQCRAKLCDDRMAGGVRSVVFGRCHNKEPHSSGILLCRVVVVGYENIRLLTRPSLVFAGSISWQGALLEKFALWSLIVTGGLSACQHIHAVCHFEFVGYHLRFTVHAVVRRAVGMLVSVGRVFMEQLHVLFLFHHLPVSCLVGWNEDFVRFLYLIDVISHPTLEIILDQSKLQALNKVQHVILKQFLL